MLTFITLFLLVLLILGHEFGHFLAAKISNVKVDEFGVGFPPRLLGKKIGETLYSLNLLPFGGFVKIHGDDHTKKVVEDSNRSFDTQPYWKKAWIILAGVLMNFLIGWLTFSAVLYIGIPEGVVVTDIAPDSPAFEAGLEPRDMLEGFESTDAFISFVNANIGKEITINGKTLIPREDHPEGEGALGVVVTDTGLKANGIIESLWLGFTNALTTFGAIFVALSGFLWGALTGNFETLSQVSGPVGVFNVVRQAGELGAVYLMQLLGLISLNLAVLNLIPFPALDGGRLLFISLRKLFGEKIFTHKIEVIVNVTGFALLLLLMIVVTYKDIVNF